MNPSAWWWLAAIPLLVLLYLLRARRTEVTVPSLFLWRAARRDRLAHRPLRQLERNLLLVLQILAVAAATFALARPQIPTTGTAGDDVVIVVDLSAGMQSTDVRPTRFEAARRAAIALASGLGRGQQIAVVGAARSPRMVVPLTSRRQDAVAALRSLRPTDGAADLDAAVRLARAQARPGRHLHVHLFSDRAAAGAMAHRFAGRPRNFGIAGLVVAPAGDGQLRAVVRVRNDTDAAEQVPLQLSVDGRATASTAVVVPAGQEATAAVAIPQGEVVEAAIPLRDDLGVDNRMAALASRPMPSVLVVGRVNPFLDGLLETLPLARRDRAREVDPTRWGVYDVVILDRTPPAALPAGSYLLFRTLPTNVPIEASRELRRPEILRWKHTHPVTRFVDWSEVRITDALALESRSGEALVEGEFPLVWGYEDRDRRLIVVAFDLERSDFALRPAFPVFFVNALEWLSGASALTVEAGDRLTMPAGSAREALLQGPDGEVTLRAQDRRFVTPPLDRAGLYTLRSGDRVRRFVVRPSSLSPVPAALPVAPPTGVDGRSGAREVASVGLLCLLALLVVEWWAYARPNVRRPLRAVRTVKP
ncbi:MAG: VWA domain-containing protein [Armatimonadota bacterium]|nr:VWA domain-containing protein [Armatimonadota bacterium]